MYTHESPIFLGVDFGTTRVKASIATRDGDILNTYSISWIEARCNKFMLSDWLVILKRVISETLKMRDIYLQSISCIAITTMSPCIVLVDPNDDFSSSPIILYDEVLPTQNNESRIKRINTSIKILNGFTPNLTGSKNIILSANAWLVWQLTGKIAIDNYSLYDILGGSQILEIEGAQLPSRVISPTTIAGNMNHKWSETLGFPPNIKVCIGSNDTVALLRATCLKANEHLIYLGTFFSVLESIIDFSNGIPSNFVSNPYKWHISLEGGALIERLAASYFPFEENRGQQITRYLETLQRDKDLVIEATNHIVTQQWALGKPVQMLPELTNSSTASNHISNLVSIPFISFTEALKTYFEKKTNEGMVHVVGGLSSPKWITEFLSKNSGKLCSSQINIHGAEGAALLAKDGFYAK